MLLPREATAGLIAPYLSPSDAGLLYEMATAPYAVRLINVRHLDGATSSPGFQFLCRTITSDELRCYTGTTIYAGAHHTSAFRLVGLVMGLDLTKLGITTTGEGPRPEEDALNRLRYGLHGACISIGGKSPSFLTVPMKDTERLFIEVEGESCKDYPHWKLD